MHQRIEPICFQAGCCKRRLNQALFVLYLVRGFCVYLELFIRATLIVLGFLHYALSLVVQCIVFGPVYVCICGFVCLWVCYQEKACIDLQTGSVGECSDHLQLIKFWLSCDDPGKGFCGRVKIFGSALL